MPRVAPFEVHYERYEAWFEKNAAAYVSELLAMRAFVPLEGKGLEIGVGSGRFAAPLGVQVGLDPSPAMLALAAARGIAAVAGVAELLPFATSSFDYALTVTTICFVDSPARMLSEARRVLRPGGILLTGFIDRESDIGWDYQAHQAESLFYRDATFHSADEVRRLLEDAGFAISTWAQTLAHPLSGARDIEALHPGRGRCAFVVVCARNDK